MDDLGLLLEELLDVRDEWYALGVQLKMRPEIPRRKFQASIDGLLEILKSWLTTSDNSSWNTLTDALKTMGEKQLAGSLERKYCLTKEMRDSKQLAVS